jgi:hypothetical protein
VEAIEQLLRKKPLEYWLTVLVESQLAHARWDFLFLIHEATEHPDVLGDLERSIRSNIAERQLEMATIGKALRQLADPEARRWLDHLQQISAWRLRGYSEIVRTLLESHGDAFGRPMALESDHDV